MKLIELNIKNFGCIDEKGITIKIDNIVVLIGPNNVGKTTVLKAYELFKNSGAPLTIDDFYQNSEKNPVQISGVFGEITEEDKIQIGEKWLYQNEDNETVITYKWIWDKSGEKGKNTLGTMWKENGFQVGWEDGIAKLQVAFPFL